MTKREGIVQAADDSRTPESVHAENLARQRAVRGTFAIHATTDTFLDAVCFLAPVSATRREIYGLARSVVLASPRLPIRMAQPHSGAELEEALLYAEDRMQ